MTYVCVRCKRTWGGDDPERDRSGGLCDHCSTEYLRGRQRKKGFHDCFRKATEVCSREECSYHEACNRQFLQRGASA
jgi:DNA-directed RNA polymerase subunit RPC12/RpoP